MKCWELHNKMLAKENSENTMMTMPSDLACNLLTIRAKKVMLRLGLHSIEGFCNYSAEQLRELKNCGNTTIDNIRYALSTIGRTLKGDTLERYLYINETMTQSKMPPTLIQLDDRCLRIFRITEERIEYWGPGWIGVPNSEECNVKVLTK